MADDDTPTNDGPTPDGNGNGEPQRGRLAVEPIEIQEEMERSFLDYAMSVITSRALPDARDGMKPVQRRILYGMYAEGMRPDRPHRKCANAVGELIEELAIERFVLKLRCDPRSILVRDSVIAGQRIVNGLVAHPRLGAGLSRAT